MRVHNNGGGLAAETEVVIREAREHDGRRLRRLAGRDSARVPQGRLLVAEQGGELLAAVPLDGGRGIADPFQRTAAIVRLLELRAQNLRVIGADVVAPRRTYRSQRGFARRALVALKR